MDLSTAHAAARDAAARLPALQASFDLLDVGAGTASIVFYAAPRPEPGEAPTGDALATILLADGAGTLDAQAFQIVLTVPVEGQVTTGGDAAWARVLDNTGAWWADCSVSDDGGSGEIKLASVTLAAGAFVRLTSAVFQG